MKLVSELEAELKDKKDEGELVNQSSSYFSDRYYDLSQQPNRYGRYQQYTPLSGTSLTASRPSGQNAPSSSPDSASGLFSALDLEPKDKKEDGELANQSSQYVPFPLEEGDASSESRRQDDLRRFSDLARADISDFPLAPVPTQAINFEGAGESHPWQVPERLQGLPFIPAGQIQLVRRLGNGAFGTVYQGKFENRFVAVKELQTNAALELLRHSKRDATKEDVIDAFAWEVGSLRGLNHPNIIQLEALYQTKDANGQYRHAMVIEFCERGSLKSMIDKIKAQGKRLNETRIIELALEMAQGLAYLHSQGRLHRDLKTENVLLDKHGRAKLADLGVAQVDVLLQDSKVIAVESGLKDYIWKSPEEFQVRDASKSSAASDIYAYGLILWNLLTGEEPYKDCSQAELIQAVAQKGWREPFPNDCPSGLKALISQCWHQDPLQRPSISKVIEQLISLADTLHSCPPLMLIEQASSSIVHEYRDKFEEYIEPYVTSYSVEEDLDEFWQRQEKPIEVNEPDIKENSENEKTESEFLKQQKQTPQAPALIVSSLAPQALERSFKDFLETPENSVFVLFGDGGSGKTLIVHHLADKLLEHYRANPNAEYHWLPVFISRGLNFWSHSALSEGIRKVLAHPLYHLSGKEGSLKQARLLFIVDRYDELQPDSPPQNLPRLLGLQEYPNAKLLVTCRRFIVPVQEEINRFALNNHLETRYLLPFNLTQMFNYFQQRLHWDALTKEHYAKAIEAAPSLRAILRNPIVLNLFVQSFASQKDFKTLRRADIYRNFIEHWLSTQSSLLGKDIQSIVQDTSKNLSESFRIFAENISFQSYTQSKLALNRAELEVSTVNDPWLNLVTLAQQSAHRQFIELQEPSKAQQDLHRRILNEQDYSRILEQRVIQFLSLCPLKEREGQIGFMHKSFFEYFLAQHLIQAIDVIDAQGPALLQFRLSKRNLRTEPGIIEFLVDELSRPASTNEGRKRILLQQILASKKHPEHAQSASNAMTLLVRLRFPFSRMDLDDIHVPDSDWIQGVFHGAFMRGINGAGVNATGACLQDSCMDESTLPGFKAGERAPLKGHAMPIRCMAFDASHNLIATGSGALNRDCGIRIWDVETGALVQSLPGHQDAVLGLFFMPNTVFSTLISISKDKKIRRWDVVAGESQVFSLAVVPQNAIALSSDGELLAFAHEEIDVKRTSEAGFISLYSFVTNNIEQTFQAHTKNITSLAFVPNKNIADKNILTNYQLASSGEDNTLKLWSLKKMKEPNLDSNFSSELLWTKNTPASPKLAFSADNQKILSCTPQGGSFFLLRNGALWQTLKDPSLQSKTLSIACSPQYTAIGDGENIQIFDKTGVSRRFLSGHTGNIIDLIFTSERENHPSLLLSASQDRTVRLWETQNFSEVAPFPQHTRPLTGVQLSLDERVLITTSLDGTIRFWDAKTSELQRTFNFANVGFTALHVDKSNEFLIAGDEKGWIYVYNLKTASLEKLKAHENSISHINTFIDATRKFLISSSQDKTLKLWDLGTKQLLKTFDENGWSSACIQRSFFSLDGCYLYTADNEGFTKRWRVDRGVRLDAVGEQYQSNTALLSSDGNQLLIAHKTNFAIEVWTITPKKCIYRYQGHQAPVQCMNWDGTGQYLISGAEDNIIHLWHKEKSKPLLELKMTAPIKSVILSQQASHLYVVQENDLSLYGFRLDNIDNQWRATLQFQIGGRLNVQDLSVNNVKHLPASLKTLFKCLKADGNSLNLQNGSESRLLSKDHYILDDRNEPPLMQAVRIRDEYKFRALIQAKVDVNQASFGDWTSLHFAAECGLGTFCALLIEAGANINQGTNDGLLRFIWGSKMARRE